MHITILTHASLLLGRYAVNIISAPNNNPKPLCCNPKPPLLLARPAEESHAGPPLMHKHSDTARRPRAKSTRLAVSIPNHRMSAVSQSVRKVPLGVHARGQLATTIRLKRGTRSLCRIQKPARRQCPGATTSDNSAKARDALAPQNAGGVHQHRPQAKHRLRRPTDMGAQLLPAS